MVERCCVMSCCHVAIRVASILQGNTSVVADLFGWGEDTDYPTLTGNDESVKTPGLFLLGSQVRHQAKKDLWIFCFIYKCEPVLAAPRVLLRARAGGRKCCFTTRTLSRTRASKIT